VTAGPSLFAAVLAALLAGQAVPAAPEERAGAPGVAPAADPGVPGVGAGAFGAVPAARAPPAFSREAVDELHRAARAQPADRETLRRYLFAAAERIKRLIVEGSFDEAIEVATQADTLKPGVPTILYHRGLAHARKGLLAEAIADYARAREASDAQGKARPEIDLGMTNACYARGDWTGALAAMKAYASHGGALDARAYLLMVSCHEKLSDVESLLRTLDEGLARFPDDRDLAAWRARYQRTVKAQAREREMAEAGTLHFSVRFENMAEDAQAKDAVLRALEAAYDQVTRSLGHVPSRSVPVVLYATHQSYATNTDAPHWMGAHYDPQDRTIRIGHAATKLGEASFREYVIHEFTHLVLDELTGQNIPAWLNEGLAQIESGRDMGPSERLIRQALRRDPGTLPGAADLVQTIDGAGASDVRMGYAVGWSLTRYITDRYGASSVSSTLVKLGKKYTFEEAFAMDYASLMKEWIAAEKARLNVQ
jgi:tetratricopeptide (TPR) repeat protein